MSQDKEAMQHTGASGRPVSTAKASQENKLVAHSVSPAFSLPCLVLFVSYVFLWSGSTSFVALTNLCFTAVAYQRVIVLYLKKETILDVLGVTATSSFIYTFLGAASLSFHLDHTLSTPAHHFDLLAGLLLLTHVLYVLLSINLYWLVVCRTPKRKKEFVLLSSATYIAAVTAMVALFDDVYERQEEIFLGITACVAVLYLSLHRKFTASPTVAVAETFTVLLCIIAASFSQSLHLGRKYRSESDEYDFYHGNWHFLLSVGTSIVYSRCTDAILNIENGGELSPCCSPRWLDRAGLLLLGSYSVLIVVFKESEASLSTSLRTLSVVAVALSIHGGAAVYQTWFVAHETAPPTAPAKAPNGGRAHHAPRRTPTPLVSVRAGRV